MGHLKLRKEKDCLNCGTIVQGRYCHNCGQENIETMETAGYLVKHFLYDLTHFEGNFFTTLKKLIIRPGKLSLEYAEGKRVRYLHPIRMYIFTSAFFFFVFFISGGIPVQNEGIPLTLNGKKFQEIMEMDSVSLAKFTSGIKGNRSMTHAEFERYYDSVIKVSGAFVIRPDYASRAQYDSLLDAGKVSDNWFQRKMVYKQFDIYERYKDKGGNALWKDFLDKFLHNFPQLLFVSLPLFALLLKLLYYRHKQLYYGNHAIFSIHLYIMAFIFLLALLVVKKIQIAMSWNWLGWIMIAIVLASLFYEYRAIRTFYRQNRLMSVFKFSLLNLGFFAMMITLGVIFFFISLFNL